MVIDCAKGVEDRTIKLMDVCRLRDTPILTFINKLDREGREPIELLDEVEDILKIQCAPITWPIGMGKGLKGVFHLYNDSVHLFSATHGGKIQEGEIIQGLDNPQLNEILGESVANDLRDEIELVKGASHEFDKEAFLAGKLTPVFFGSAINNFGIEELLDYFVSAAPGPQARLTHEREVKPEEDKFSGFIFKIQANMDPSHRDRVAFMRVCSGTYQQGMKMKHVRIGKDVKVANAITLIASNREHVEEDYPDDIIGLHNHGTIQIGDTFTQGESLKFRGITNFEPERFRRRALKRPIKDKSVAKRVRSVK